MLPSITANTSQAIRATRSAFLIAGMIASSNALLAQSDIPDAQVESNVLKSLASAPELANEAITTRTTYGTVTLSGSVRDEANRRKAEDLTANTVGVKKVVDELTLGTSAVAGVVPTVPGPGPMVLQSDGTYAPAPAADQAQTSPVTPPQQVEQAPAPQRNNPDSDQELDRQREQAEQAQQGSAGPPDNRPAPAPPPYAAESGSGPYGRRPINPQAYPYPQDGGYPPPSPQGSYPGQYPTRGYPQRYPQQYPQGQQPVYGGQPAGQPVMIPAGALVRVRINRALSSDKSQRGATFDGIIVNDVSAGGFVAIPRGATVQGTVVESKSSGALKGRGELSIQLTQVTLAGRPYPIVSDVWAQHGGDKTIETVNKTAGFGAAGLILGAIAGGGTGAAIGGGIGAAAGLGSSAASGNGQVYIPSEGLVTFHLAQDAHVETVSEQEMQRLAYGVAPGADQRNLRPRNYPRVFVGPGYPPYYPGPYGPYGYPPY